MEHHPRHRQLTRKERYKAKAPQAVSFPVAVAVTNFSYDANVAYVMRALACFGGETIHIIGKVPPENELKRLSGGHSDLIKVIHHQNPSDFNDWVYDHGHYVIVAELTDDAVSIYEADIPLDRPVIFVIGNEMEGVPVEMTLNAQESVFIPMPGKGFCLNTSQTGNILLYEYQRRVNMGE